MSTHLLDDRATRLFIALAAFFCVNAMLAEFIGVKIFALEDTLGIAPMEWSNSDARPAGVRDVTLPNLPEAVRA